MLIMGSEGEIWRKAKEVSRNKKDQNYLRSKVLLKENKIEFTEKPNGHFIIGDYDFWITTGLFIHRKTKKRGRGVFNLIKKIKC